MSICGPLKYEQTVSEDPHHCERKLDLFCSAYLGPKLITKFAFNTTNPALPPPHILHLSFPLLRHTSPHYVHLPVKVKLNHITVFINITWMIDFLFCIECSLLHILSASRLHSQSWLEPLDSLQDGLFLCLHSSSSSFSYSSGHSPNQSVQDLLAGTEEKGWWQELRDVDREEHTLAVLEFVEMKLHPPAGSVMAKQGDGDWQLLREGGSGGQFLQLRAGFFVGEWGEHHVQLHVGGDHGQLHQLWPGVCVGRGGEQLAQLYLI